VAVDVRGARDVFGGGGLEQAAERARSRSGFLLGLPGYVYLLLFFVLPLVIVFVYSFATRGAFGQTILADWNLRSYARLFDPLVMRIVFRSLWLATAATAISLVIGYPFAYYIATRSSRVRYALLLLVMIPFWTNFLVRTYAWRVILGSDGPVAQITGALGMQPVRLLFTDTAILIGLVYGFLPFMVLPLYAAIDRLDWSLVEAARDLYASGWTAFRRVTLPLSKPGILAGSILVFIPSFGAFVTPELLGGARTTMVGSYIFNQFMSARDWPFGSALSSVLLLVMLVATLVYFRKGGRTL
jgi:spermidine/putrescine transport system permease protein